VNSIQFIRYIDFENGTKSLMKHRIVYFYENLLEFVYERGVREPPEE